MVSPGQLQPKTAACASNVDHGASLKVQNTRTGTGANATREDGNIASNELQPYQLALDPSLASTSVSFFHHPPSDHIDQTMDSLHLDPSSTAHGYAHPSFYPSKQELQGQGMVSKELPLRPAMPTATAQCPDSSFYSDLALVHEGAQLPTPNHQLALQIEGGQSLLDEMGSYLITIQDKTDESSAAHMPTMVGAPTMALPSESLSTPVQGSPLPPVSSTPLQEYSIVNNRQELPSSSNSYINQPHAPLPPSPSTNLPPVPTTMSKPSSPSLSHPSVPSSPSATVPALDILPPIPTSSPTQTPPSQQFPPATEGPIPRVQLANLTISQDRTEYSRPIPQPSEDWAALIDTPASPVQAHASRMMPSFQQQAQFQPQFRGQFMNHHHQHHLSGSGVYTDSPAADSTDSGDYLQHSRVLSSGIPLPPVSPTSLDMATPLSQQPQQPQQPSPPPLQQHSHSNSNGQMVFQQYPYQHQHHPSNMSVPPSTGVKRMSWSANTTLETLDSTTTAANTTSPPPGHYQNSYGYLTPPRHGSGSNSGSGSRSGVHSKNSSVATSVSLLTDAAIVAKYRETAIKTNDPSLQLSYAKYLLEIGETCVPEQESSSPTTATTPSSPPLKVATGEAAGRKSSSSLSSSSRSSSSSPSPTPTQQQQPQQDGASSEEMGKKQLIQEAIYWIDRLAKEGQPEAQFIRGTWHEEGLYACKKSTDKALRWYQSASKGDYGPAHYKVATYCERKKDNNKAVMLFKKAAVQNEVPANHRLAMIYLYGELGQSKNMKAGLQYLKQAASHATENSPMSPYVLGLILSREYKQLSIPDDIAFPDDGEALEWFKKSAMLGYGPANYKLGYCYEYGTLGCIIDPFLSIQHYDRAVQAGDGNGEAEMALSGWYLSGAENCFSADDGLAFSYASQAAAKDLHKAQYAVGYYYEVGISVPKDMDKAVEYYKKAAANGNKEAMVRLSERSPSFDRVGHRNSIRRIKQGRNSKDSNCTIM